MIALFFVFMLAADAQPGERSKEKIEAYKIAFFTEKLQLTPEESKDFWPLFNQFEDERDGLKNSYKLEDRKIELMSDKEVEDFVMQHFEMEEKLVKLRRDYSRRLMEVLPIRKIALLQRIDNDFKRHLLEQIQKRQEKTRTTRFAAQAEKLEVRAASLLRLLENYPTLPRS